MIVAVNDNIREAIIVALHRQKMTRRQLAERTGLSYAYVSRLLSGHTEGGREAWEAIFDTLGLELTVVPKEKGR